MNRPLLVIVTGRPGSGKTTLAKRLGSTACLPVVCRDEIKEGYVHTMGVSHEELQDGNLMATNQFFRTIESLLDGGISLIAEAAFQHKLWSDRLEPLMKKARIVVMICLPGDDMTAYRRYLKRRSEDPMRVYFHGDAGEEESEAPLYVPPEMNAPAIWVNTTDGYAPTMEELIVWMMKTPCETAQNPL